MGRVFNKASGADADQACVTSTVQPNQPAEEEGKFYVSDTINSLDPKTWTSIGS